VLTEKVEGDNLVRGRFRARRVEALVHVLERSRDVLCSKGEFSLLCPFRNLLCWKGFQVSSFGFLVQAFGVRGLELRVCQLWVRATRYLGLNAY